jgi:hypothetical protein
MTIWTGSPGCLQGLTERHLLLVRTAPTSRRGQLAPWHRTRGSGPMSSGRALWPGASAELQQDIARSCRSRRFLRPHPYRSRFSADRAWRRSSAQLARSARAWRFADGHPGCSRSTGSGHARMALDFLTSNNGPARLPCRKLGFAADDRRVAGRR